MSLQNFEPKKQKNKKPQTKKPRYRKPGNQYISYSQVMESPAPLSILTPTLAPDRPLPATTGVAARGVGVKAAR